MEENDVIEIVKEFIATKFPKECECCGRRYDSFADFLHNTFHLGKPMSYDAESGDWQPVEPLGTLSMATCSCGTTLAISSSGMNVKTLWRLMKWAKTETEERGISPGELLNTLRSRTDESVLRDEATRETERKQPD
ncbi:MAG: hypothetical protein QGH15_19955 [Kiritimatiellia bacterium]|jgi:hypothetical protein|nr:hypothetical protein [Kiritimatiellia bacterium]